MKELASVIHDMIGESSWKSITANYKDIQKIQLKLVRKLEQAIAHDNSLSYIADAYLSTFSVRYPPLVFTLQRIIFLQGSVLQSYVEYATNFEKGWEKLVECLKHFPELRRYIKAHISNGDADFL